MIANTQYLINRAPSATRCHRCKRVTLSGIDCGMPYHVDAYPLTLEGELHARLAGAPVYRLIAGFITYREAVHIADDYPVIAEHRCTPVVPADIAIPHIPAFLALTEPPRPAEEWPSLLELDPDTNTLRPVPPVDPPPPF